MTRRSVMRAAPDGTTSELPFSGWPLARDAAGVLWRYSGTGTGQFGGRVKIGTGWQMYSSLF
ncbi:hypothetical protein [Streptomyces sp. CBMA29]|uniref:hypothetical protein n=1 Tax=Streptomyces sp. CBMA29 TaxID=1896314 RepID=UPI001662106F|nr:hypothetical protein [Streptomyces sp. CBMA29]